MGVISPHILWFRQEVGAGVCTETAQWFAFFGQHALVVLIIFVDFLSVSSCVWVVVCLFVWRTNPGGSRCPDIFFFHHSTVLCDFSCHVSRTRSFGRSCCCSLQLNAKQLPSVKGTQFYFAACDFKWHAISPPDSGFARKVVSDQVRAQNGISSSHF